MYADSALSLVVPLCVIALVFITRRVVLSLFVGILLAGIMLEDSAFKVLQYIFMPSLASFTAKGKCNLMPCMSLDS